MSGYWIFFQSVHETTINRFHEGKESTYEKLPADAQVGVDDVVFLLNGYDYLYGWGKVAQVGETKVDQSGRKFRDVTLDPRVLVRGLANFELIKQNVALEEKRDFETRPHQELGNRFLRLPEYAPGRKVRDSRSDVTMAVGILFYLITGRAPRQLFDENLRMPHIAMAGEIPRDVSSDPRWPAVERLLTVGFQHRIEDRFQTSGQLRQAINRLLARQTEEDFLSDQFANLREILQAPEVRLPILAMDHIEKATVLLRKLLESYFETSDLSVEVRYGYSREEHSSNFHCRVYRKELSGVSAALDHRLQFANSQYTASYSIEGSGVWNDYYGGPAIDPESLEEAIQEEAPKMAKELVQQYISVLRSRTMRK